MMEDTATVAKSMQAGPEFCSGSSGQFGPGSEPANPAMGKEGGMDNDVAQKGGRDGAYGYEHPQGGCQNGAPEVPPYGGANPPYFGAGSVHPPRQTPGEAYAYGAFGPQGVPPGMTGVSHQSGYEGTYGYAHPQGGCWNGAPEVPPHGGANPTFQGAGQVHPSGRMPGAGYSFPHPGPQYSGQGAPTMGYQQPQPHSQAPGQDSHACEHGSDSGPGHPKHDAHQFGQFMGLVNDIANGKTDPSQVMAFLGSLDTQFWKGALVGISATLLLTNDTIKSAIGDTLSGVMGAFEKEKENKQSE